MFLFVSYNATLFNRKQLFNNQLPCLCVSVSSFLVVCLVKICCNFNMMIINKVALTHVKIHFFSSFCLMNMSTGELVAWWFQLLLPRKCGLSGRTLAHMLVVASAWHD